MGANLVLKLLSSCKRLPLLNPRSPKNSYCSTSQFCQSLFDELFHFMVSVWLRACQPAWVTMRM